MGEVESTTGRDKKRTHNFSQELKWMRPSARMRNRSEDGIKVHLNIMTLAEVYWIHLVLDRD
jgi:hypothetical protein